MMEETNLEELNENETVDENTEETEVTTDANDATTIPENDSQNKSYSKMDAFKDAGLLGLILGASLIVGYAIGETAVAAVKKLFGWFKKRTTKNKDTEEA